MIPILYYGNETQFTSNGIGRLTEIISCEVTEERNGIYEVEFTYPAEGRFYNLLVSMAEAYAVGARNSQGIIACIHDDKHDIQPFDIYGYSAPIDGIATFYAHHISYRLGGMILKPVNVSSVAQLFGAIPTNSAGADSSNFTYWTDKVATGDFETTVPKQIRGLLGGEEGSILDIYGKGEYEFNKFNVKLYVNRGVNSGVTIRYGKNLVDATREMDNSDRYNAIAPYWIGSVFDDETGESVEEIVYLSGNGYVQGTNSTGIPVIVEMDLSAEFDEKPTEAQLRAKALQFLDDNTPWVPNNNITVDFVQLWQTTEYENVAALQRVSLCDTVSVYYPEIGIVASNQKVIKAVYDVLLERYSEMEIGDASTSLADSITEDLRAQYEADLEKAKRNAATYDMLQAAIDHATEMITGGLGGYVVFKMNANGQPEEILIMDTPDINTAVNVWRFNRNGLGHSHNGYNGPFSDVALTADGAINASMMTTGQLNANIIKAGIIQDQTQTNYWNLETGQFQLQAYATKTYADSAGAGAAAAAANAAIADYDANQLTQTKIFNKLTNNGSLQGIYMQNNTLYINATYIASGILKLGGQNNGNGLLEVYGNTRYHTATYDNKMFDLGNDGFRVFDTWYSVNNRPVALLIDDYGLEMFRRLNGSTGFLETVYGIDEYGFFANRVSTFQKNNFTHEFQIGLTTYSASGATYDHIADISGSTCPIQITAKDYVRLLVASGEYFRLEKKLSSHSGGGLPSGAYQALMNYSHIASSVPLYVDNNILCELPIFCGGVQCPDKNIACRTINSQLPKSRVMDTKDFGTRLLYCYEMPSPIFGDLGDGAIDETGFAYIYIDPIFEKTIDSDSLYQVFLQKYGPGDCWVSERKSGYFVVEGTPGLKFGWELKGKQADCYQHRLDEPIDDPENIKVRFEISEEDYDAHNYGTEAADYIQEIMEGRIEI